MSYNTEIDVTVKIILCTIKWFEIFVCATIHLEATAKKITKIITWSSFQIIKIRVKIQNNASTVYIFRMQSPYLSNLVSLQIAKMDTHTFVFIIIGYKFKFQNRANIFSEYFHLNFNPAQIPLLLSRGKDFLRLVEWNALTFKSEGGEWNDQSESS